jgi:hypothetical protein
MISMLEVIKIYWLFSKLFGCFVQNDIKLYLAAIDMREKQTLKIHIYDEISQNRQFIFVSNRIMIIISTFW